MRKNHLNLIAICILGIRSQSKPHDIMYEVYRAMKTLDFVRFSNFIAYFYQFVLHFLPLNRNGRLSIRSTSAFVARTRLMKNTLKCLYNSTRLITSPFYLISSRSALKKMNSSVPVMKLKLSLFFKLKL